VGFDGVALRRNGSWSRHDFVLLHVPHTRCPAHALRKDAEHLRHFLRFATPATSGANSTIVPSGHFFVTGAASGFMPFKNLNTSLSVDKTSVVLSAIISL